ncbi:hypothetical protein CSUB01_10159 [Colletotrichum sublineola]|uniref:Uncharacterized protein n=1 Tax=Colletotrichum sublineola TaxID=1173701 RepID=A0A066X313_COLSU|nr:hypothetical protein CSUB01_10159 [Colletotrichum sublineola]
MATRPLKRSRQSAGWPSKPTDIDNEVVALGGTTHAIDFTEATIQSQKVPVSREKRLEELVRDSGRLRQELDYWKGVARNGSTLIANVDEAVTQLHDIVSRLRSAVDDVNSAVGEKSMARRNPSEEDPYGDIDIQTGWRQDLPLTEIDVLMKPAARAREGFVVDLKKSPRQLQYNDGGWF